MIFHTNYIANILAKLWAWKKKKKKKTHTLVVRLPCITRVKCQFLPGVPQKNAHLLTLSFHPAESSFHAISPSQPILFSTLAGCHSCDVIKFNAVLSEPNHMP